MVDIVIYRNEEDPIKNEPCCEKAGLFAAPLFSLHG